MTKLLRAFAYFAAIFWLLVLGAWIGAALKPEGSVYIGCGSTILDMRQTSTIVEEEGNCPAWVNGEEVGGTYVGSGALVNKLPDGNYLVPNFENN